MQICISNFRGKLPLSAYTFTEGSSWFHCSQKTYSSTVYRSAIKLNAKKDCVVPRF